MKRFLLLCAAFALSGCGSGVGVSGNLAEYITSGLQTIQPVESAVACAAQALANQTAAAAMVAGNAEISAGAIVASGVAGTFCNNLPAGAPLPAPVAVSGTTAVPVVGGTVTLPVPAVAPKTS